MKKSGTPHIALNTHEKRVEIPDPAVLAEAVVVFSESTLELATAVRKWADDLEALTNTFQVLEN